MRLKMYSTVSTLCSIAFLLGLIHTATGLSCYRCGTLADSARNVKDCDPSQQSQVEQCGINEACVVFKRLYKKGSASLRGCYPVSDTLPGLRGAQIFPQRECDFQPKRRSPVKVCMCTTDLCNDMEYDIHSDRARRLFNQSLPTDPRLESTNQQPDLMVQPSERKTSGSSSGGYFQDPATEEEWSGDAEDFLSVWENWDKDVEADGTENEILMRTPRQASQAGEGLECYSCGSLFNFSAPSCPTFDPLNRGQRQVCPPGHGCLLYTWKKSDTEIGSFRECFPTVAPLGQERMPVSVTRNCQLQRTQADPSSSIRACICTSNLCNDNPNEGSKSTKGKPRGACWLLTPKTLTKTNPLLQSSRVLPSLSLSRQVSHGSMSNLNEPTYKLEMPTTIHLQRMTIKKAVAK